MSDRYIFVQSSLAPANIVDAEEEIRLLRSKISNLSDELEYCHEKLRKSDQKCANLRTEKAALLTDNKILSCKYELEQQRRMEAEAANLRFRGMEAELERLKSNYASVMNELKRETEAFKRFHKNANEECGVIVEQLAAAQTRLQEEEEKSRSLEEQVFGLKDLLSMSKAGADRSQRKLAELANVESDNTSLKRRLLVVNATIREMKITCRKVASATRDAIDAIAPVASWRHEEASKGSLRSSVLRLFYPKARARKVEKFGDFLRFTAENTSKLQKAMEEIEKALL